MAHRSLLTLVIISFLVDNLEQSDCSRSVGLMDMRMLHRFSPEAAQQLRNKKLHDVSNLAMGSHDYYSFLHTQDRFRHHHRLHRHRRGLIASSSSSSVKNEELFFSSGNQTMDYGEAFGWLHYAVIDLGTPNASFLVALDTGSNLLWVPCKCEQCAPTTATSQVIDITLNVYNPATSQTSEVVACGSSICEVTEKADCETKTAECPYTVQYLSDNTSTSGVLIQDVLHLSSQSHPSGHLKAPIVFGCGQVQSGGFLDGGAPDGLLGLGMGKVAVPSYLAEEGLVKDTFSMCFHPDNSGRIFFGDKGPPSQQTTEFLPINGTYLLYTVGLDSILVGVTKLNVKGLSIIVDSGTSFTYLPQRAYSLVTAEFDAQVRHRRTSSLNVPWEFCYELSGRDLEAPTMSLTFHGGGNLSVFSPLIGLSNENGTMIDAFCLAILQSEIAILGQSFMIGYKLVFDREDSKLGWSPSDCYKVDGEDGRSDAEAPSSSISSPPLPQPPSSVGASGQLNTSAITPFPSTLPPRTSSAAAVPPSFWNSPSALLQAFSSIASSLTIAIVF